MSVSDLIEEGDGLQFKFHLLPDQNCTTINRLKQIISSEIETYAIDLVEITTNTSDIYDEVLSDRLTLIPIRKIGDEIPTLTLEISPVVDSYLVTTKDLRVVGAVPVADDVVLCKLLRGQSIDLKAEIKLGTGRKHAKWSPLTHFTYRKIEGTSGYLVEMTSLGTVSPSTLLKLGLKLLTQ